MNPQKICISKQATFISLILFLLLGYVLFAYKTMVSTTNTNSRASTTTKSALASITPPDCAKGGCQQLIQQPVLSIGEKTQYVQFVNVIKSEQLSLSKNAMYGVFIKKNGDAWKNAKLIFTSSGSSLVSQLQTFYPIYSIPLSIKNIRDYQFYIYALPPPTTSK